MVLAGCVQAPTDGTAQDPPVDSPPSPLVAASENASSSTDPSPPAGEATIESKITLLVSGSQPASDDRLGVTITLPPGYRDLTVKLSWNASYPTNTRLALRLHEAGVLDEEGRVAGSSRLINEVAGESPVNLKVDEADLPPGTYDVHAFTPEDDATAVILDQPFTIRASWGGASR